MSKHRRIGLACGAGIVVLVVALSASYFLESADAGRSISAYDGAMSAEAVKSEVQEPAPDPVAEQSAAAPAEASEDSAEVVANHALAPWTGDLDGMIERGFLRILTVYNPLYFSYDGVSQKGLAVDIGLAFEEYLLKIAGKKAGSLNLVMIPVSRDELLPYLVEGKGDIAAANLTITPERQELVQFSDPTYPDVSELLITGPAAGEVKSLDDMVSQELYLRKSSSYYEHMVVLNEERKQAGKPEIPIIEADEHLEDYDLLEMVNASLVPAVVVDSHKANLWAQVFEKIVVHEDVAINAGGQIAWALRKDSPKLLEAVNGFVKDIQKGSLLGNILLKRYLTSTDWIDNVREGTAAERYESTADLIKKYAGEYDFDWLLIMAQGYQESKLDQEKRSHAGAVGIMQVMPATAADPNVGIDDIEKPEPNIHAGVKYLRFLRDRYFDKEEISPLDQVLFSFAAYNAGPANISKARKKAAAMGLDPNQWFGQTEIAVARSISREPVIYVRNIYKYYVAYNQISGIREARQDVD
jgi:membrane-bound lytic murein transglycosylase MltF